MVDDSLPSANSSYTGLSGTVFYALPKVRFAIGLDNLTNKRYWDVYGTPQLPRRLKASMIFRF
ncbi:TonB-dependent receptor [Arachidicoccus terrestris]|uniref:TonB-dependent receptor n=1 Tax=Arachidicoccus terrestris TaxID=2875539 RepID=UPI001CC6E430|nr:TonB-dependent receptor [Arachidicoccus terrestris]UAY55400.1 TonB-dependent receptor [Arachidicoccus terrestris]